MSVTIYNESDWMLRINTFTSAAGAIDYFNESLAGDYYAEDEQTIGVWGGRGADRLGLSGQIKKEDFQDLINNRDPEGNRLRPGWTREGRSGFDFTFDVPKSVSLIYQLTQNELIREAFEEACIETMAILEHEAAVRVRKGGANHDRFTGELTYSRFTHHSSRPVKGEPGDPNLHAHFFVHNLSWDSGNKGYKALQAGEIMASAYYFEALHHSKMAEKMKAMGFPIERTGQNWEVAGAPEGMIDKFSRRTAEIEEEIRRRGVKSQKSKSEMGAKLRSKKEHTTLEELRERWAEKLTLEERSWLNNVQGETFIPDLGFRATVADAALQFSILDWFGSYSLVPERRILATALKHCVGKADIDDLLEAIERNGLISKKTGGKYYFTTAEVEAEEHCMLSFARSGQGSLKPIASGVHEFKRDFLNVGQRAAVTHVLNSEDKVTAIRGAAGTGKTTLMLEAIEKMQEKGLKVRTFAPSSDASRSTLRKEGFKDAETLAMLLINKKVQESVKGGVIWVDEAGMIGSRDMWKLFLLSDKLNARIILSGDYKQHSAVQRGDSLRLLIEQKAIKSREITEILRQRGEYKKAIKELSEGRVGDGFQILDDLQAIREVENDDERSAKVAQDYITLLEQKRSALVVSPTHQEANKVTNEIRDRLKEKKTLKNNDKPVYQQVNRYWGEGTKSDASSYSMGDILQFAKPAPGFKIGDRIEVTGSHKNGSVPYRFLDGREKKAEIPLDKPDRFQVYRQREIEIASGERIRITQGGSLPNRYRLENGSFHTVKKVNDNGEMELSNGVAMPKHWGNFNYAYVATSYASQGKTVDEVLISQSSDSFPASSREQFYVSSSRGRENLRIYTDSKEDLLNAVGASQVRRSAMEASSLTKTELELRKKAHSPKSRTKGEEKPSSDMTPDTSPDDSVKPKENASDHKVGTPKEKESELNTTSEESLTKKEKEIRKKPSEATTTEAASEQITTQLTNQKKAISPRKSTPKPLANSPKKPVSTTKPKSPPKPTKPNNPKTPPRKTPTIGLIRPSQKPPKPVKQANPKPKTLPRPSKGK